MTDNCCHQDTLQTVRDLAERYPSLLGDAQSGQAISVLLAECGYRLADGEDIIRAQSGRAVMQDFLPCRVVKIIACI